jgi:hypothetical protein
MEFVLVTFPRVRPVRMDGATQGQTGQIIGVQRGVHIFDLGSPMDYTPPSVQTRVTNTTSAAPLVVAFESAVFAPPLPAPPPAGQPGAIALAAPLPGGGTPPSPRKAAGRKKRGSSKKTAAKRKAASKRAAPKRKTASRKKPVSRKKPDGRKKKSSRKRARPKR